MAEENKQNIFNKDIYAKLALSENELREVSIDEAIVRILKDDNLLQAVCKGNHKLVLAEYDWYDKVGSDDPNPEYTHQKLCLTSKGLKYSLHERKCVGNWDYDDYTLEAEVILDDENKLVVDFIRGMPLKGTNDPEIIQLYSGKQNPSKVLDDSITGSKILKNLESEVNRILKPINFDEKK